MKKIILSIVGAELFIIVLVGMAWATPMYYTFEGEISSLGLNPSVPSNAGFYLGKTISYTFLVDFDRVGFTTFSDGEVYSYADDADFDYFYSDFINGDVITDVQIGYIEVNSGYNNSGGAPFKGVIAGDAVTYVASYDYFVTDWAIGDILKGVDRYVDFLSDGGYRNSQMESILTLTSITPVPEPATILLFCAGLAIMGGTSIRRKRNKKC